MRKSGHQPDYVFIFCIVILVAFGLIMLSSASSDLGKIKFNDTYYYLKHQILFGLSLGLIGFLVAFFVHYRFWQKISFFLLLTSLFLLVLVFTPLGFSHAGANRWLDLGLLSIQPAEFLKFTFIIYLAAWLSPSASLRTGSKKDKGFHRQTSILSGYLPFLVISGLVGLLVVLQPSTTTVVIVMTAGLLVYFASGARLSFVLGTILLGFLALVLIISITPYRLARVQSYFQTLTGNETADYQSDSYHLDQALMSIGSGGVWGVGFGNSTTKFKYLPEPISDSIFAVIAEEFGFIGAVFLLSVFILLFIKGIMIAKNSRDQFAKLVTVGFISVIAIQTFIHVAAISGILPLTGVPLPFISYGGTALAVFLTMSGVIANISKYTYD